MSTKASAKSTLFDETNAYIKRQFQSKLIEILESASNNETNEDKILFANNIWMLNDVVIPFTGNGPQLNFFRLKYSPPENYLASYAHLTKIILTNINEKLIKETSTELTTPHPNFSLDISRSHIIDVNCQQATFSRYNIITHFACNKQGKRSPPFVLLPRNNELEPDLYTHALYNHLHFEEISSGEFNELKSFAKWLYRFVEDLELDTATQRKNQPLVLILNVFFYYFLFLNVKAGTEEILDELVTFCTNKRVYLLFYPLETQASVLNRNILKKFQEEWTPILEHCGARRNPYAQTTLIMVYNHAIRTMLSCVQSNQSDYVHDLMYECLNEMFSVYKISETLLDKCGIGECMKHKSLTKDTETHEEDMGDDEENTEQSKSIKTSLLVRNFALNPTDVDELVTWVDGMSEMGSLCIKHTFLKELYVRQRTNVASYSTNSGDCSNFGLSKYKENLAKEKRWSEFIKKNKALFKTKYSCGLNESDYLIRWTDDDIWHMSYFNFIKQKCKITSPDSLWTFDIIQFPYLPASGILKAPENDYSKRPHYSKPRISVIFAFSATGDYITPFIVYPENFKQSDANELPAELNANECFAPNGYVTCRVFELWLTKCFLPYLGQKKTTLARCLLLFCGKLSIMDTQNFKLCMGATKPRVNLFTFSSEKQMPFNVLFQKTVRKRQIDLFHDSWSKCTAKLNLSFLFRCKSRTQFFNIFTDAFQNCIEEIGNKEDNVTTSSRIDLVVATTPLTPTTNDSVTNFKNKMIKSFEQCHLWPLNNDTYKTYAEAAKKKLDEMEKAVNDNDEDEGVGVGVEEEEDDDDEDEEDNGVSDEDEEIESNEDIENQPPISSTDTASKKSSTIDSEDVGDDDNFQPPKKRARASTAQVSVSKLRRRHSTSTITIPTPILTPMTVVATKRGRKPKVSTQIDIPETSSVTPQPIVLNTIPARVDTPPLCNTPTNPEIQSSPIVSITNQDAKGNAPTDTKKVNNRPDTPAPKEPKSARRDSLKIKRFSFDPKAKIVADLAISSQIEADNEVRVILESTCCQKESDEANNKMDVDAQETSSDKFESRLIVRKMLAVLVEKNFLSDTNEKNLSKGLMTINDYEKLVLSELRRDTSTAAKEEIRYEENFLNKFWSPN